MSETISNIPERLDIRSKAGANRAFTMKFHLADGTPRPITGQAVTMRVRKKHTSNATLLDVTAVVGTNVGVDDHHAVFSLSAAQMASVPCGCWVHDIDRDDAGTIHPAVLGSFEVLEDV